MLAKTIALLFVLESLTINIDHDNSLSEVSRNRSHQLFGLFENNKRRYNRRRYNRRRFNRNRSYTNRRRNSIMGLNLGRLGSFKLFG